MLLDHFLFLWDGLVCEVSRTISGGEDDHWRSHTNNKYSRTINKYHRTNNKYTRS